MGVELDHSQQGESRLGTFKNKLQRRMYGIMREEIAATNCVRSLMIYSPCQILD
jgi:hypothetical protein